MPSSQFFSEYRYPITLKPITHPQYKETHTDIFNLQNSFRILVHQLDDTFAETVPEAPEDGKLYGRKDKTWEEITGEGGGGSLIIQSISIPEGLNDLAVGKVAALLTISVSAPARIRVYCTSAGRTADAGRALGTKAAKSAGLIFEFNATSAMLAADLNPVPTGHNGDTPFNSHFYANVQPVAGTVTVDFNYTQLVA